MEFINTKILLAILAIILVIAGVAVKWEMDYSAEKALIEQKIEQKKKNNTIEFDPEKVPPPLTADNLFD